MIAITEVQEAIQGSIREWASRAGTLAAVRALEPTIVGSGSSEPVDRLWTNVAGLGLFSIALPENVGGAGGTVADLAAALEQAADALVPGPVLPTVLASLLLAAQAGTPVAKELLPSLATGHVKVAVALTAGTMAGAWLDDGALRVSGRVGPVLGAGGAGTLLLAAETDRGEVWFVLDTDQRGVEVIARDAVDFSRPLGDVLLSDVVISPQRLLTGVRADGVRDVAATLFAAEAAGVAGWCLRTAVEHAKSRHQFGRPIGSFQAIKHLCAVMACRVELATAVAWDAARALAEAPREHPLAAAAGAAIALDAAVDNAKDCIQVLGGIGFTWEHDAHLYLRRALALRQLLGGGAVWRERAADLAVRGVRRRLAVDVEADRSRVREKVAEIAALPEERRRAALADAGYLAPQWPGPYGLAAGATEQLILADELRRAGVSRPDLAIAGWAVPTILSYGTEAQRERFAGPSLRGEITWCQLFSEPEAGSDLASLRTRAVRVDGGWRLTGQKVWTSLAREAHWAICLARTDLDVPKHRGLSYFLVDMASQGIDIRPLREITGRAVFNEVFLDEVFVPDECLVGAVGDGWRLARATLASERVAMGRGSSLGDGVEALVEAARSGDPGARERLGALVAEGLAMSLLDQRSVLRQLAGSEPGAESAIRKLVGVGHRQAVAEAALTLCGPDGAAEDRDAADPVYEFLLTRCLSIAGGTTQILLSMVGERVLGLPREP